MKRFLSLLLTALLLVAAVGCTNAHANATGSAENTGKTEETAVQATEAPATEAPATEEPKNTEEEPTVNNNPIVTITMQDGGVMKLELYPDVAPNTVKNFISLANAGFYDGLIFHRIIAGFMIQGGCFNAKGMPNEPGYSIKGEFASNGFENNLKHTRGVISMARTMVPDSAGAQFFIMHKDAPHLDGEYAAFGMLLEGFDVLDSIATLQTDRNDVPLVFPVIESIRVETFGVDYGEPEKIQ
jgi:peptidyl-prolyl cis-trans isomerase B (cyclophilin B)